MINVAVIFAGGSGTRMKSSGLPKQFLELYGKPVIIYTLEQFERHPMIDFIVVACIGTHIKYLQSLIERFHLLKVKSIVIGGKSGQESIYNALSEVNRLVSNPERTIVLIHDGVRPLIDQETITKNIKKVIESGTCITTVPLIETVMFEQSKRAGWQVPKRENCLIARAPQSFYLSEILKAHQKAIADKIDTFSDSCSLMHHYGYKLEVVEGKLENIKITTPTDFFVFKAILDAKENSRIFGLS